MEDNLQKRRRHNVNWSANNVHLFLLVGYALSLPFNEPYGKLTNVILILMACNWVRVRRFSFKSTTLGLMVLFYIMHIIGLWSTENMKQGIFELDKKISFLILPIVMQAFILDERSICKVLIAFALGTFTASLVCLSYASWRYLAFGDSGYFFYHPLTEVIDMHAIYMAMYVCFTSFILIYYYWEKALFGTWRMKCVFMLCLSYLAFFVFLLSARTVILSFSFIVFAGIVVYGYRTKRLIKALGVIVVLLLFFSALVFLNDNNRERFKEAINYNSEYTIDKQYGGRSTRELIWSCAASLIKQNPVLGWGTGDAQDVLHACYLKNDFGPLTYLPHLKYNAHSQYFQSWIDLGLAGLLAFALSILIPFFQNIKSKNYLYLSFIALFALACTTESMLELKQGITFFAFFQCLFELKDRDGDRHH
jgi:O-antigen ligase